MKFFIINSFRLMVYIAYLATIIIGLMLAYYNAVPQKGAMSLTWSASPDPWLKCCLSLLCQLEAGSLPALLLA